MKKLLSLFIIQFLAFTISAMNVEPPPSTPVATFNDAANFYKYIVERIARLSLDALKNKPGTNQDPSGIPQIIQTKFADVGVVIPPEDVRGLFFNIDKDAVERYPATLKKIYQFLLDNGVLVDIGTLYLRNIINEPSTIKSVLIYHNQIKPHIEPFLNQFDAESSSSILLTKNKSYLFHKVEKGILFRNRLFTQAINPEPHLKDLFNESEELDLLLKKSIEINKTIQEKSEALLQMLNRHHPENSPSKESARNAFMALIAHEAIPPILKHRLQRSLERENIVELAYLLRKHIGNSIVISKERQNFLNGVAPAPIDVFFVYCLHLFEESKTDLFGPKAFPVMEAFSDLEDLSVSHLLATSAHQVMGSLGLNFEENAEQPPVKAKKKSQPAKKNKNGRQKAPKKVPKHPGQSAKKVAHDEESDEEECKKQVLPSSKSAYENLNKPKKAKTIIYSLNDTKNPLSIPLTLTKGHRMLDRIARLLAYEVVLEMGNSASSISLALLPSETQPKMIIATKSNRANQYLLECLQNILKQARGERIDSIAEKMGPLKEQFIDCKQALLDESAKNLFDCNNKIKATRRAIDLKKLTLFLNSPAPLEPVLKNLHRLLQNIDAENVVILNNIFNWHSELVVADYIRRSRINLHDIDSALGKIHYQYIGGSLPNCAKCNALLYGGADFVAHNHAPKSSIILYSRGHFKGLYPGYVAPGHYCYLNKANQLELSKRLNAIDGEKVQDLPYFSKLKMQIIDLSDSEDEQDKD